MNILIVKGRFADSWRVDTAINEQLWRRYVSIDTLISASGKDTVIKDRIFGRSVVFVYTVNINL